MCVYEELSAPVNNLREAESCYRRISDQLTANYISSLTFSNCFFFFPSVEVHGKKKKKRVEAEAGGLRSGITRSRGNPYMTSD